MPADLRCPCGADAPADLPPRGARPRICSACFTPLVRPGVPEGPVVEKALAAGLVTAALAAGSWLLVSLALADDAPAVMVAGGVLVGLATRWAAGVGGTAVQVAAGISFTSLVAQGEALLYHFALEPWLVSLHEAEGAPDALMRAKEEMSDMDPWHFLQVASSLEAFVALALGLAAALWLCRAPAAVTACLPPPGAEE